MLNVFKVTVFANCMCYNGQFLNSVTAITDRFLCQPVAILATLSLTGSVLVVVGAHINKSDGAVIGGRKKI